MLTNYFKTAWRTITKNKAYASTNIVGLTVGICACMLVATVVIDDFSYDRQWSKSDRLFRIVTVNKMSEGLYDRFASSFTGLATSLKNDFPEVETVAELSTGKSNLNFGGVDANGVEVNMLYADTTVWQMLDLPVLSGDPQTYVAGKSNIAITESFSKKFFGNEDPVGKIIYDVPTYSDQPREYLVTGIIKDLPANSILRAEVIQLKKGRTEALNKEQYGTFAQNYILLKPHTDVAKFTKKVNDWYAGFVEVAKPYQFEFQPLKDAYLHSGFAEYQTVKGDYKNSYILCGVAIMLLIIACINFVNLTTARAVKRLKETGVRKILGAARRQLICQFLAESTLFFLIATVLATAVYIGSLQAVEAYLEHQLAFTLLSKAYLFAASYGIIIVISLLSGLYPAYIMSGFKPAATLKATRYVGDFSPQNLVRKSLVVIQFAISITVLIGLIVVRQQVSFMNHKDIGFNKNNLLSIGSVSWDDKGNAFKQELLRDPGIETASFSTWLPTKGAGYMSREIENPDQPGSEITVWYINGDVDLAKTLGLKLISGRLLNSSFSSDTVRQDFVMQLNGKQSDSIHNQQSSLFTAYTSKILHVNKLDETVTVVKTKPVGIIEDFNNESLKTPMQPTIIIADNAPSYSGMLVRVKPGKEKQVTAHLEKLWRQFFPTKLLATNWVDDMLAKQYRAESKLQELFAFFSGLSMLLAMMGIFGLVVQSTSQRVKEIGIRKVLGASVSSIVTLFSGGFLGLILIAILIASPVAWYATHQWLQDFAYRVPVSWWIFATAGFTAIAIAMITISFQSIKAAFANPVNSLRTE